MSENQTTDAGFDAREIAWKRYESRLANRTTNEEASIRAAWHSGWTARDNAQRAKKEPTMANSDTTQPMKVVCLGTVEFTYTNWRGETARRRAMFLNLFWGTTEWHPEPQWFVEAQDLGRFSDTDYKVRHFALRDMKDVTYEP